MNEIIIEDTRKKASRLYIFNKKGHLVHNEEKEVVIETISLRKIFVKRKSNSLFRICKTEFYEFNRELRMFSPLKVA